MKKYILISICFFVQWSISAQDAGEKMDDIVAAKYLVIDSLNSVLEKAPNDTKVLTKIIEEYMSIDHDSLALFYVADLFKIQKKNGDENEIAESRLLKADILFRLYKDEEALALLNENLGAAIGEKRKVDTYSSLSSYYNRTGQFEKSLNFAKENEKFYLKNNVSLGLVSIYSTIAITYFSLNRKEETIAYFEKAILYCTKEKVFNKAAILLNMSIILSEISDFDKAIVKLQKAEEVIENNEVFELYPILYKTFGIIHFLKKEHRKSLDYCLKSLELVKKNNPPKQDLASLYKYLGFNYYSLHNYKEAIYYLERRDQLDVNNIELQEYEGVLVLAEHPLINSYSKIGNDKKALETLKKYSKIRDSFVTLEQNIKLNEITEKYENEKKQQQIEKLNIRGALQEVKLNRQSYIIYTAIGSVLVLLVFGFIVYKNYKSRQKLKESKQSLERARLKHRFLRTQLNPHFFFHALSSIESYVYKGEKEQVAGFLQDFSKLMRNILESSDVDFVPLQEDIGFIERYLELQRLMHGYKFNYTITVHDDVNTINSMVPPMLFQPFIENAIIHGALQTQNGHVTILISKDSDQLIIKIGDNREKHSRDTHNAKKLYRSMSTDIVRERVENLRKIQNFHITFSTLTEENDSSQKGTVVILSIPLPSTRRQQCKNKANGCKYRPPKNPLCLIVGKEG
ncbi:MAG: histidine kinase [Flavobacteriaceae bacterium]|nr:histidine kinase [Flavobacteriaceae bacterium]